MLLFVFFPETNNETEMKRKAIETKFGTHGRSSDSPDHSSSEKTNKQTKQPHLFRKQTSKTTLAHNPKTMEEKQKKMRESKLTWS